MTGLVVYIGNFNSAFFLPKGYYIIPQTRNTEKCEGFATKKTLFAGPEILTWER